MAARKYTAISKHRFRQGTIYSVLILVLMDDTIVGDLRMILERVMLETYFPNEVIYEQEATVFK